MTRAGQDRILKDANGDISDHLQYHIHLTNCIHLKNHMHRKSPVLMANRSLVRDLVALQKSRSFRDPSMSPREGLLGRVDRDSSMDDGRRSIGVDFPRDLRGVVGSSPIVSPCDVLGNSDQADCGLGECRRGKREVVSAGNIGTDSVASGDGGLGIGDGLDGINRQRRKILKDFSIDGVHSPSHCHVYGGSHGQDQSYRLFRVSDASTHPQHGNLKKGRRRRFRNTRRIRASATAIDSDYEAYASQNASTFPSNGCGIPVNWSRIHDKGKSIIDRAGRSLSRGLSDPSRSNNSKSSSMPEGLPLLVSTSVSRGSTSNASQAHDYSGESSFCTGNILKHEIDSEVSSEARLGGKHKHQGNLRARHQSLTQKYMPRTFRELVGQHLVAQALSNAAVKRNAGLMYLFYGPHGTGKTSTAHIFSKALNCHSLEPPKPCGVCKSCVAHDMGKSRNIREVGPASNIDYESIMYLLDDMAVSRLPSAYRILIFDDCESLTNDCWSTILKVIDRAPRRTVFVLVCSTLDVVPYIIISRCQRFFFPKLKDADIIYALQWIATKEDLQIDKDALKLIASKSSGSLRDAEMTLEQLSLLGQRISVPLVQEMVGLISDEKLVDLLDFALSADTVNTLKNLRDIMESSVDPLALMAQLATVITDILFGGYNFSKEGHRKKFFHQQPLSKGETKKLRHALKTLSEAEKHLRMSNDRLTWLTATLLQLAPEQQSLLPNSSTGTSLYSSLRESNSSDRERPKKSNVEQLERSSHKNALAAKSIIESQDGTSGDSSYDTNFSAINADSPRLGNMTSSDRNRASSSQLPGKYYGEVDDIWLDVLEQIRVNSIKEFLYAEGKLISVGRGAAPVVQLGFSSDLTKSTAERFRTCIMQAFESVLGSPVTIEIQLQSMEEVREPPFILMASTDGTSPIDADFSFHGRGVLRRPLFNNSGTGNSEIVGLDAPPIANNEHDSRKGNAQNRSSLENGAEPEQHSSTPSIADQKKSLGRNQYQSLVKGKVSLGNVIQHSRGYSQQSGWSRRKAVSIAEKLEQENMRMESRSRSFFWCWKSSKMNQKKTKKPSYWKIRSRKPRRLLKFMTCGKGIYTKSPSRSEA